MNESEILQNAREFLFRFYRLREKIYTWSEGATISDFDTKYNCYRRKFKWGDNRQQLKPIENGKTFFIYTSNCPPNNENNQIDDLFGEESQKFIVLYSV